MDNEITEVLEQDKFNRLEQIKQLIQDINKDFKLQNSSYALRLNGDYGTGKSTFLKLWQAELKSQGYEYICLDAWYNSYFDDEPALLILYELSKHAGIASRQKAKADLLKMADKLLAASSKYSNYALAAHKIFQFFKPKSSGVFKDIDDRRKIYEEFKKCLTEFCGSLEGKPFYIFIDELDRARPDYAIKFLETIKHFFSIQGIIFVVAVNKQQLFSSMKHRYGQDMNIYGYDLRFTTREFDLPEYRKQDIYSFINENFANNDIHQNILSIMTDMLWIFRLTLREMEYFIKCIHNLAPSNFRHIYSDPLYLEACSFLLCVYIKHNDLYHKIGQSLVELPEIFNLLTQSLKIKPLNKNELKHIVLAAIIPALNSTTLRYYLMRKNNISTLSPQPEEERELMQYLPKKEDLKDFNIDIAILPTNSMFNEIYSKFQLWLPIFNYTKVQEFHLKTP